MKYDLIIPVIISFAVSVILGPLVIPFLRKLKVGQTVRDDGPKTHLSKSGTPTMGGILILIGIVAASVFYIKDYPKIIPILFLTLGFGLVGFLDDFIKIKKKRNLGLTAKQKLLFQILISVAFGIIIVKSGFTQPTLSIPFTSITWNLGWLYIPFITVFMVGFTNAVNLTDGLDGLATSVTVVVCAFFTFAAIMLRDLQMSYFSCILAGSLVGFLIYNFHPAKVFMGDTGSLFLGGAISIFAINLKLEILLLLTGIIYVVEALSVIIQVISFKTTGKRVFLMSPIHHHFEMKGMKEVSVVYAFSLVTLIFCEISAISII